MDQRRAQLDALLVAQGELLNVVAAAPRHAQAPGPPLHGRGRIRLGQAVQAGEVLELSPYGHARIETALLGHVSDSAAGLHVERAAVPRHGPRVRRHHAEHDAHGRRLACAVGADESEDLPSADVKAEIPQGPQTPEGFIETAYL